jgi:hypothetical protein
MFRHLASRNEHADSERVLAGLATSHAQSIVPPSRYKTTKRFGVDGGEAAVAGAADADAADAADA